MAAILDAISTHLDDYTLEDRYRRESGRVFMTGTQALVKLPLMQRAMDRAAGLNTAGFISGYRGSPLGGYDQELWRAKSYLDAANVDFLPAVNEDLAATAVHGTQQVEADPNRTVDGVFSLWYGKGPGLDRAGDALKHGNAYGSSPNGGVLVVAGDDHGCVSSSMPHQSDVAFLTWLMPNLHPASVAEYLEFGLFGIALSRFSGMWVGFKAISDVVESGASFELPDYPRFVRPPNFVAPPGGLHIRWPDFPGPQIEERLEAKKAATLAFAEANPIDRKIFDNGSARYGIVTTGKAHLDLMEALRLLGIDRAEAERIGLDVYKVGMVWPLAHDSALDFVRGKREVLVIEEKRGLIESQFKEYFYDYPGRKPERMVGKEDETGRPLVPWVGELTPTTLAGIVARRLDATGLTRGLTERADALRPAANVIDISGATRTPYFCSGCPHNTSTKVPDGSEALAGIGCHFMASWMDRDTSGLIQMGGEGVNWITRSRFNGNRHVFQNLGDGTYYHSGSLAIRQAVAANTNITFKILFNDAVAMTGGQPVDGPISVQAIAHSVRAEGIDRIALVSDEPELFSADDFPDGITISHRRDLDAVQRELRDIPGVTILLYAQTCATEKRRRRKRGLLEQPKKFAVINDLVCEGCGDCSVESNCLSVIPKETPFGRKRQIDQDSCNKDFSCVNGFCPSFVTVTGDRQAATPDAKAAPSFPDAKIAALPEPALPSVGLGYDLLVTGVGGTGVVTVGALITMAAHLNRQGASVLDFMGFAQKFGPVLSYIRIAATPADLNQVRIDDGQADALIGCDLVVSSSPKASSTYRKGTRAVVNETELATADFVQHPDANMRAARRLREIGDAVGHKNLRVVAANELASRYLGDSIFANVVMLGYAWQGGLVPVPRNALEAAIEQNGVRVRENLRAFNLGRLAAHDSSLLTADNGEDRDTSADTLDAEIERRAAFLVDYQDASLARKYRELVARAQQAEQAVGGDEERPFTRAVAKAYFKTLAYKDEYEVARLHTRPEFLEDLKRQFGESATLRFHLAPPLLPAPLDARGRPRKREFGAWLLPLFRALASMRRVRGTKLDVFGYTAERKAERALIVHFESSIDSLLSGLTRDNLDAAAAAVELYLKIRGYGPVKEAAALEIMPKIERALRDAISSAQQAA